VLITLISSFLFSLTQITTNLQFGFFLMDDVAYFISNATSIKAITSQFFETKDSIEYMAEMDQANSIILSSVKQIISTLSSTLYALSIHWTKESKSGYLSIPNFIPSSRRLPCLTELYLCINLRSYTLDPRRDTYPKSMFYKRKKFLNKFNRLTFPALRRLRLAGLAWSAVESPYNMIKRMAPNLTHVRTKTDLMRCAPDSLVHILTHFLIIQLFSGALGPFTFPTNLNVLIEVPDMTLRGEDVESLMNDRDFVRNLGYDPHHVTVIGMRIRDAYDAHCWEAHWAAALRGEAGHWPEPGDLILSSRE
jgi:hypothetical protein